MGIKDKLETTFHYFDLDLTPYKHQGLQTSSNLMKKIAQNVIDALKGGNVFIFDRKEKEANPDTRNLLIFSLRFENNSQIRGKIALLRDKLPVFLQPDNLNVSELENIEDRKLAEITHFCIDLRNKLPFVMYEYNYSGPRISDFEYYFRKLGKEYDLAKYCKASIRVKGELKNILNNMKNVAEIEMKVRSDRAIFLKDINSKYYSTIMELNKSYPFQSIKLSTSFSRSKKNIGALDLARKLLSYFQTNNSKFEYVDDLKMNVDTGNGFEVFDVISQKEFEVLYITPSSIGRPDSKELFSLVLSSIDKYHS